MQITSKILSHETLVCRIVHFVPAESIEAGSVVDHDEGAVKYHHIDNWSFGEPNLRIGYCYLHICSDRDATVFKRLH